MEKTLRIKMDCPSGGRKIYFDENGNVHAGKLQRYIETAKFLECNVLQFNDTTIKLKNEEQS